jgi:hypothetical protein
VLCTSGGSRTTDERTRTAEAGITVFRVAFERRVDPANHHGLQRLIRESLEGLRAAVTAT